MLNYGIVIFSLITDIKDGATERDMNNTLNVAFEFIDGFTADKNTQVKLYTVLYNIFKQNERFRYHVFVKLLDYWEANNCAVVIRNNLRIIDEISKNWDITVDERIEMYKKAVKLFKALDEQLDAYELMLKTLELFGDDKNLISTHKEFIEGTIKLALQHPKIAQFGELYNLPAVKTQREEKTDEKLIELLHIFTYDNLEEYAKWESTNKQYLESANIDPQVCRNKITYLSFCSLALKDNVIGYDELAKIVAIKREDIEDWIIDAIVNNIIDARIDQENEKIIINTFTQRTSNLKERLDKTAEDFRVVLQLIRPK